MCVGVNTLVPENWEARSCCLLAFDKLGFASLCVSAKVYTGKVTFSKPFGLYCHCMRWLILGKALALPWKHLWMLGNIVWMISIALRKIGLLEY